MLPESGDLVPSAVEVTLDEAVEPVLSSYAAVACSLHEFGKTAVIDPERSAYAIRERLRAIGLADRHGRLRRDAVGREFFKFASATRSVPDLATVASSPSVAYSQLTRVVAQYGDGLHPLRLCAVVVWLFSTFEEFVDLGREFQPDGPANTQQLSDSNPDQQRRLKLSELNALGVPVSAAAKSLGIHVATAQAWLAQAGIETPRRGAIIRGAVKATIVKALEAGMDKKSVSMRNRVSESSVNRVLRTEVGLHTRWQDARRSQKMRDYRDAWEQGLESFGGPKLARAALGSAYAWLYRHDRTWLMSMNANHETQRRGNNSDVQWDVRDQQLSDVVRRAGARAFEQGISLRLIDLLESVPELKCKLSVLTRLPLTHRALDLVLRSRSDAPHKI